MAKKQNKNAAQPKAVNPQKYFKERVRQLPLEKCWVGEDPEDPTGLKVAVVTRRMPSGQLAVGYFMLDMHCLGVKDASYRVKMPDSELKELIDTFPLPFEEADYNYVHNLILGAVEYAEELGIEPHRDFDTAQYILAEDTDDIPMMDIEYGRNGRPCLWIGPDKKESKYIGVLEKNVGPGNFDYVYDGEMPYDTTDMSEEDFQQLCQELMVGTYERNPDADEEEDQYFDAMRQLLAAGKITAQGLYQSQHDNMLDTVESALEDDSDKENQSEFLDSVCRDLDNDSFADSDDYSDHEKVDLQIVKNRMKADGITAREYFEINDAEDLRPE